MLSGGSTRFSANDTYARAATSPEEVAWSAIPVTDESNDVVFRLKISRTQEPGNYESSVAYVLVPEF